MLVLNIFCSVCKVQFEKDHTIYSTSCGHVFHFTCMNQWQCRSTSCPLCRTYKPETFRIYLNFEDVCENDFEAKLKANEKKIAEMQETINKRDKKIDEIKRLYNVSEQWRGELQDKIERLMLNPESKLNAKDDKELENISPENLKLREKLFAYETVNIGLNQKIEVLELKLKLVTDELKTRIEETVGRSVANTERKHSDSIFEECRKITKKDQQIKTAMNLNNINKSTLMTNGSKIINREEKNCCKVVIQDFPKTKLNSATSHKAAVILLASEISVFLNENDIANVDIAAKQGGQQRSNKINLIVTFTSIERKEEFLSNKVLLKINSSTESIRIKEFMNNDAYTLFKYANKNLRPRGYNFIYPKGNTVIAKKNYSDRKEILIKNKNDVDRLLGKHLAINLFD